MLELAHSVQDNETQLPALVQLKRKLMERNVAVEIAAKLLSGLAVRVLSN